ncbi:MAG: sigma-70 family RNA polymerase sigma factor [Verrucomicrobia bacterium]|nr:sigma-70 family RNA polymerase sigma factor [Verrucomicrobiota bacterium]
MNERVQILCESAKDGDADAASELLELFHEPIFAFLRRWTGDQDDACDLTQKTFVKAWVSLGSFQGRSRFSTWLHGIARHVYVDWRRKRGTGELRTDEWWGACASESGNPCDDAAQQDLAGRVYALLTQNEEVHRLKSETRDLHKLRNEVRHLREQTQGLDLLRAENERLTAAMAELPEAQAPEIPRPAFTLEQLKFSGYGTPEEIRMPFKRIGDDWKLSMPPSR